MAESMKVSDILSAQFMEASSLKEKKVQDAFSFTLKRLGEDDLAQRLSSLIENITFQGKKIADHMDISDLKQYRSLISDFINEVVTNSHQFSRENVLDRRGRHRVYSIIRLVNQNVDDLAQELLKSEKNHLDILGRIDEIRGMLLDILV